DKYTDRARGFVQSAQSLALREGHQQFAPEHLLKVLLDDPEGVAAGLIDRAGGRPPPAPAGPPAGPPPAPDTEGRRARARHSHPPLARIFDAAEKAAEGANAEKVDTDHLLLAIAASKDNEAGKAVSKAGVTIHNLNEAMKAPRFEALKRYARDLTQAVRDGK